MLTNIALLSLAVISTPAPVVRHPPVYRPRIELWTNRGDGAVYNRGERVELYFRLDQDAYVTVFRIDTDGRVRVLFPREPWEDNFARGGRDFEVDGDQLGRDAFAIDDYAGVGYLFAVAAPDPFVYDQIENGDHWDYRVIADGRVRGDPYVALTDLAQRIVPEGYADWDYDIVSYNVERHHDYPRFLCYDCHSYVSYSYWDPYYYSCVRFRMFVYDDPWYYPYRYGGSRVVFVRPYRPQPRFIFKDWGSARPTRDGFVTRERERPVNDNTRRGVTRRDLDGLGIVPPPNVRDRREQPGSDGTNIRVDNRGGRGRNEDAGNTNDRPNNDGGGRRGNEGTGNTNDRPNNDGGGRRGTEGSSQRPMVLPPRERQQEQQPKNEPRLREVEPRRVEPRSEPRREEPRRVEPRNEPRSQPRAEPRNEPRNEPRSQPRAEPRSQPRAEPRNEPRSQPRAEPAREKPRNEPEVRRRKP